jgi:mannose-6-phosphate isomerase-like protein (cupin superfamily)
MVIKPGQMIPEVRDNMRGGTGSVNLAQVFTSENLPKNVRLSAVITLEPGCSIGWHVHEKETEIFYFAQGSGVADDNGEKKAVLAGDVLVTPDGCGHAVENSGTVNLVFFAVIALN